jgi:3-phosphoglycerate kinase
MALDSPKYYIFTGGGAVLKAIEKGTHLGIAPIDELIKYAKIKYCQNL